MAYSHQQTSHMFIVNATAAAAMGSFLGSGTGEKGRVSLGAQRYILRRVEFLMYASTTTKKPVISVRLATTAGATSATGQEIFKVSFASTRVAGTVITSPNKRTAIGAGSELICHVLTAATKALKFRAIAVVEPNWETPANITKVVTATA